MPSIFEDDQNKEFQNSSNKILGWVLLRDKTAHSSELKVPAWSSFNQILESEQNLSQGPLSYIVLEADQTIYAKILGVMFKLESENNKIFDKIIDSMGGFHATICLFRTIFNCFRNTGPV